MCGIMGYVGNRPAKNIIYTGLQRLEYRGYDSAGIALLGGATTETAKEAGDTSHIDLTALDDASTLGIGHTRWATHGKPSKENAHPHTFGAITLAHNGIIENYVDLKRYIDEGKLQSETDSEVLAGLIDHYFNESHDLLDATKRALGNVKGTFGVALFSPEAPGQIIAARRGSPIVIGVGEKQHYVASDSAAIIDHTDQVIYLKDDQIAVVTADSLELYDLKLNHQHADIETLDIAQQSLDRSGFTSYLEKEIHEQPDALRSVILGRVGSDDSIVLGGPNLTPADIASLQHVVIIACGTAYYAGYYAKYLLEEALGIPFSVEHASEFRYRYGAYDTATTLAIFMSQSGETADTLASLREAKRRGMKTMGIVNTVGSTIAREVSNGGIYLHAGVESSVASTKAYSSMVAALLMFGGFIAYRTGKNAAITHRIARELLSLPEEVGHTLALGNHIEKIAAKVGKYHDWFILGRGPLYPVALEGSLKLTEVAYIHAQAFPTGEMKHGPIALVGKEHLSVVLLPEDDLLYEKSLSALQELRARDGHILTISTRPKEAISDYHIEISHSGAYTNGLIYNVCLQLLTLKIAARKGLNIDRPRNLAKSVTVE